MLNIKRTILILVGIIMLLLSAAAGLAEDSELMFGIYGSGDTQLTPNPIYEYSLYGKEAAANPGLIGGVGGAPAGPADIVVTPIRAEITVTAGKTAETTFRITNLGHSEARVDITIQPTTDRKILDRSTIDGKSDIQNVVIPSVDYKGNYKDVQVAVATDFALDQPYQDFYTLDVLIDGDTVSRKMYTLVVTIQPPPRVSPFSVLGLTIADFGGVEPVCVTDPETGVETCKEAGILGKPLNFTLGLLLLMLLIGAVLSYIIVLVVRRRRESAIIKSRGDYYYAEPVDEDDYDDIEYDSEEGYHFD